MAKKGLPNAEPVATLLNSLESLVMKNHYIYHGVWKMAIVGTVLQLHRAFTRLGTALKKSLLG